MTEFYVKVEPNSEVFRIEDGAVPKIYVTSKPENGRANAELKQKLSEVLGSEIGMLSGASSRRKKLMTDLGREELERRISEAAEK